jgi:hypothetical protein
MLGSSRVAAQLAASQEGLGSMSEWRTTSCHSVQKLLYSDAVLYGCETWSLTLSSGHRLKVFEHKMLKRIYWSKWEEGCAIAQAVSCRLPTSAAHVRSQVTSCGICGGQSGTEAGFLRVFRFSLPILIPPSAPYPSLSIRNWYNRPNNGRRTKWTQCHLTPRNKELN